MTVHAHTDEDALEVLRQHDIADPYADPMYVFADTEFRRHQLIVLADADQDILVPVQLRRLTTRAGLAFTDAVSPYGYGGVYAPEAGVSFRDTWESVRELLRELGAVSYFVRLPPYAGRISSTACAALDTRHTGAVIVVPTDDAESYFDEAEPRCRTKVRKGWRNELTVRIEPFTAHLVQPYHALYTAHMNRIDAAPRYLFNREYFHALTAMERADTMIATVFLHDAVMAQCLFFMIGDEIHCHLTADAPEARKLSAGNVLYDSIIRWAVTMDARSVSLGGGPTPDHPLYRFKVSFGGDPVPYLTVHEVLRPTEFERLAASDDPQTTFPPFAPSSAL